MTKKPNVGRSIKRTPAKHNLMDKLAGNEVGMVTRVLSARHNVTNARMIDLTAGDASPPGCLTISDWRKNCSPGILAHHGAHATVPTLIEIYERATGTFDALLNNLTERLPHLGYEPASWSPTGSDFGWRHKKAPTIIVPLNKSGADANITGISSATSVFVTHDPNHINDWAMRPTFAQEVRLLTPWFRSITTMGCNIGGLKRLELTERKRWYDFLNSISAQLYAHHDLFLCAINGDASQWGYLIETSQKSQHREALEYFANSAFNANGLELRNAWLRRTEQEFKTIVHELFLTKEERAAA